MTRRVLRVLVVVALVVGTVAPAMAAPEREIGLAARIEMAAFVGAGQQPIVEFTLRNDSPQDVYMLQWQTPFRGLEHEIFDVRVDGVEAEYIGPHIKFGPPQPEHYIRLAAGASRTVSVDLAELYDFSRTGEYSVQYRVNVQDAIKLDGALPAPRFLTSNRVFAAVERPDLGFRQRPDAARLVTGEASTSFVKCTATQQSQLLTARTNATSYSSNSASYLNSNQTGSRYTTWFGAYTSSRYSTVRSHFGSILSAFQNANVTFNCGCKKPYYAYVYSNQPYTIYPCKYFWSAPATGTDSKAGTLVHEMSHFTVVAGTDDHAYGQSACKNLALTNPAAAVDNADNHEYFAENTPALN